MTSLGLGVPAGSAFNAHRGAALVVDAENGRPCPMPGTYPSPTLQQDIPVRWRLLNPAYAGQDGGLAETFSNAFLEGFKACLAPRSIVVWWVQVPIRRMGQQMARWVQP